MKKSGVYISVISVVISFAVLYGARQRRPWAFDAARFRYEGVTQLASESASSLNFHEARLKLDPSASAYASLAAALFSEAKRSDRDDLYERARAAANESLRQSPFGNQVARLVLIKSAQARHEFTRSLNMIAEFEKEFGVKDQAEVLKITAYLALAEGEKARTAAGRLVERIPVSNSFVLRALAFEKTGQLANALEDFEAAISLEDASDAQTASWSRSLAARFYLNAGMYAEAELILREALKAQPDSAFALSLLGKTLRKLDRFAESEAATLGAYSIAPNPVFLTELGILYRDFGQAGKAMEFFDAAEKVLREDLANGRYGHRLQLMDLLLERNSNPQEIVTLGREELAVRPIPEVYEKIAAAERRM